MSTIKKYVADEKLPPEELDDISRSLLKAHKRHQRANKWSSLLEEKHQVERAEKKQAKLRPLRWAIGIAASIAILIGGYFLSNLFTAAPSPQALATTFLTEVTPPASGNIRKGGQRLSASEYFDLKEYQKAIPAFEEAIEKGEAAPNATLLLGISLLYEQQPQQAIEQFNRFQTTNPDLAEEFRDILAWYASVAHLQLNQLPAAKQQLLQLQAGDWRYEEAQKWIRIISKNNE